MSWKNKLIKPLKKWRIVRGDTVQILSGKDTGKQGKVVCVQREKNRVIVGGLNTHVRTIPGGKGIPSGRIQSEAPLHISNVALVDPSTNKPTRTRTMFTEEGQKVRVARKTKTIIPKPPWERKDFKSRSGYIEGSYDTKADDVMARSFIPSLLTFEEEILASLKDNTPAQTDKT